MDHSSDTLDSISLDHLFCSLSLVLEPAIWKLWDAVEGKNASIRDEQRKISLELQRMEVENQDMILQIMKYVTENIVELQISRVLSA